MNTLLVIVFVLVIAIGVFVTYRNIKVNNQNRKLNEQRCERIKPLIDKLEASENLSTEDVEPFAENLTTRESTYQLLAEHNKLNLFPKKFNDLVSGAASNLANWLEFPTELDACPDEMEHIKRVTMDFDGKNNLVHYEVFKYRVDEPHWAAEHGWILGVVGPYFDDSKPYDFPSATFSRIGTMENGISPDEEVKWVHENISVRR